MLAIIRNCDRAGILKFFKRSFCIINNDNPILVNQTILQPGLIPIAITRTAIFCPHSNSDDCLPTPLGIVVDFANGHF